MEIWSRELDISETRHLEHELVAFPLGHVESSQIGGRDVAALGKVITHHAELLEHVAADIHAFVASHAPVTLESRISLQFFGADRAGVAAQVTVETRWRDKRAHERGDRVDGRLVRDSLGVDAAELIR